MPKVGPILGNSRGYRKRTAHNGQPIHEYLMACEQCQKERWVYRRYILEGRSKICSSCGMKNALKSCNSPEGKLRRCKGKNHHFYVRGFLLVDGYRMVRLTLGDPFRPMADKNGRIREHRLVMAKHLGRLLEPWEVVHHKNQNRADNRIENLELLTVGVHVLVTRMERQINELRAENERLKSACKNQV